LCSRCIGYEGSDGIEAPSPLIQGRYQPAAFVVLIPRVDRRRLLAASAQRFWKRCQATGSLPGTRRQSTLPIPKRLWRRTAAGNAIWQALAKPPPRARERPACHAMRPSESRRRQALATRESRAAGSRPAFGPGVWPQSRRAERKTGSSAGGSISNHMPSLIRVPRPGFCRALGYIRSTRTISNFLRQKCVDCRDSKC